jgi:hypothetical protein
MTDIVEEMARQVDNLLRMTVPVPAGCVAPEGSPMSPEFRVSVQLVTEAGVHFIMHADGHSSGTLDLVASRHGLALLAPYKEGETQAERIARTVSAFTTPAIVERRIGELQRVAEQGEAALQAMMDAWFDFHDHHSLTQPVTGAAGCAFELALEARDKIRASLEQRSDQ